MQTLFKPLGVPHLLIYHWLVWAAVSGPDSQLGAILQSYIAKGLNTGMNGRENSNGLKSWCLSMLHRGEHVSEECKM